MKTVLGSIVGATLMIVSGLGCINPGAIHSTARTDAGVPPIDAPVGQDVSTACDPTLAKGIGATCTCDHECAIGFCVEGTCCNSACTGGCRTCSAASLEGICVFRRAGTAPRQASDCPVDPPPGCGNDGTCDGVGSCRRYLGTICSAGTCDGDAVVGGHVCDGTGQCQPRGAATICAPYTCDPEAGACVASCTSSAECNGGQACVRGSCGKSARGARCLSDEECASGFCADGVCCNVACRGGCLSCNLSGREGSCWPLDAGSADTRGVCADTGAPSCGHDGTCDGLGGCANYARDTACTAPSCVGNVLQTPGTCDGLGTCQPPVPQDCHPFRCVSGTCRSSCQQSADCDVGIACVNNTCGAKQDGQSCAESSECQHGHCVDGVCCDQACTGACRSCALLSAPGKCTPVASGSTDPRAMCPAQGAASCGTNGRCDGSGSCARWAVGTICAGEKCSGNTYTPPSTCSATGQCVVPDALDCFPFACNGTRCFSGCGRDSDCTPPNICSLGSCGLKRLGASCGTGAECLSTFCAQGVCCEKACSGPCLTCAASASAGNCTNVPANVVDPAGRCQDQGSTTCGTNGRCDGAGACQVINGVTCAAN